MLMELIAKSLPIAVLVNDAYLKLDLTTESYYSYLLKINNLLDYQGIAFFSYILQLLIIQASIVILRKHLSKKLFIILSIVTAGFLLLCGIAALIQLIVYFMSKKDTLNVQIMKSFESGLIAKGGEDMFKFQVRFIKRLTVFLKKKQQRLIMNDIYRRTWKNINVVDFSKTETFFKI